MSQDFSVLREINYKYFQPGHWKCFPLHSPSQESSGGGEAGRQAGAVHLLTVSTSASPRAEC